jgi:hypothetical protein
VDLVHLCPDLGGAETAVEEARLVLFGEESFATAQRAADASGAIWIAGC